MKNVHVIKGRRITSDIKFLVHYITNTKIIEEKILQQKPERIVKIIAEFLGVKYKNGQAHEWFAEATGAY